MNLLQQHLATLFPLDGRRNWYSRWSGNRLDLYVKSNFSNSPEAFREGVIDIGYLIQALDHSLQKEDHLLEIRSFPSMDQAQWVASVRLHRTSGRQNRTEMPRSTSGDPVETIAELALAWNYSFLFIDRAGSPFTTEDDPADSTRQPIRGVLETSGNNPFIWLQIGRWLRAARDLLLQTNPELVLEWETRLPDELLKEIPVLSEQAPWENLIPDERLERSKRWTPQLLLRLHSTEA